MNGSGAFVNDRGDTDLWQRSKDITARSAENSNQTRAFPAKVMRRISARNVLRFLPHNGLRT